MDRRLACLAVLVIAALGCSASIPASPSSLSTSTPAPAGGPYAGTWSGSTSQGFPMSFVVSGNEVQLATFGFACSGASPAKNIVVSLGVPAQIAATGFAVSGLGYTFKGLFHSATSASGTISVGPLVAGTCSVAATATWSAAK